MTDFGINWWIWFNVLLVTLLLTDLKFLRRDKPSKSVWACAAWISIAALFGLLIFYAKGKTKALEFATGYIIEESLSIDNLFVFLMIFRHFHVPNAWQTKILYYGIFGAIVMRLSLIVAGIALIQVSHWMLVFFGLFLVATGIMMFAKQKEITQPKPSPLVAVVKRFLPCTDTWDPEHFFVRIDGKLFATPAFLVLCTVETTDLIFALDSIPAIFAITLDPFIVYSCNALAVVGLRSLFFVFKELLEYFEYLHYGVSLILIFIGTKMVISPFYQIATATSLAVVATILLTSMLIPKKRGVG